MGKALERFFVNMPGWAFVLVGMSILSMAVLVPAWVDSQKLNYQHDLLKLQAKRWNEQESNYRQFAKALEGNDPVVLERLAIYQLRLKPAGTAPIDQVMVASTLTPRPGPQRPVPITSVRNNGRGGVYATTEMVAPPMPIGPSAPIVPTIESMLRRPIPTAGVDYPAYQMLPSRIVRITTGPLRWPFLAAGFLLVVAGLIAKTRSDIAPDPVEEAATPTAETGTATALEEAPVTAVAEPPAVQQAVAEGIAEPIAEPIASAPAPAPIVAPSPETPSA